MDTLAKPTLFSHDAEFRKNHYRSHYQNKNWLQKTFNTAMPIQTHTRISIDFRIVLENDFTNANVNKCY